MHIMEMSVFGAGLFCTGPAAEAEGTGDGSESSAAGCRIKHGRPLLAEAPQLRWGSILKILHQHFKQDKPANSSVYCTCICTFSPFTRGHHAAKDFILNVSFGWDGFVVLVVSVTMYWKCRLLLTLAGIFLLNRILQPPTRNVLPNETEIKYF